MHNNAGIAWDLTLFPSTRFTLLTKKVIRRLAQLAETWPSSNILLFHCHLTLAVLSSSTISFKPIPRVNFQHANNDAE